MKACGTGATVKGLVGHHDVSRVWVKIRAKSRSMARTGLCPAFPLKHSELTRNWALKIGKFHPMGYPDSLVMKAVAAQKCLVNIKNERSRMSSLLQGMRVSFG